MAMKKMILTGLGSEQDFTSVKKLETKYYLVFNDGELRVPVSEEAAQVVVQAMYGGQEQAGEEEESEEEEQEAEPEHHHHSWGNGHGDVTDEDGIDQV